MLLPSFFFYAEETDNPDYVEFNAHLESDERKKLQKILERQLNTINVKLYLMPSCEDEDGERQELMIKIRHLLSNDNIRKSVKISVEIIHLQSGKIIRKEKILSFQKETAHFLDILEGQESLPHYGEVQINGRLDVI